MDELLDTSFSEHCHIQAYADDILLITTGNNLQQLEAVTNTALNTIAEWGKSNKLTFSPEKTHMITISRKAQPAKIHFNNIPLNFSHNFKILGIIIDRNLSFTNHAKYVTDKTLKIYHKLCLFVRPTWGLRAENVATIYEHVIEPLITYGAEIWGGSTKYKTVQQQLRGLQRGFAIKIIRGFRTISTTAAIALADLTPLDLKVNEVADIQRTKREGISPYLRDNIMLEGPIHHSKLAHPSQRSAIQLVLEPSEEELTLLINTPNMTKIYTDGSKHNGRVGAAAIIYHLDGKKTTLRYKLHNCCTVFQAESQAILKALAYCSLKHIYNTIIFSDSKSALLELNNCNSLNPTIHQAQSIIRDIETSNHGQIKIVWVKAHCGLAGNEEADAAAKTAADLHKKPEYAMFPLSHYKHLRKNQTQEEGNMVYTASNTGEITKRWLPDTDAIKKLRDSTAITFHLTQVLTGHGYHKQYLHKMKITADDLCPCDHLSQQTIDHLLKDCPRFCLHRHDHEAVCSSLKLDPYKLNEIIKKESSVQSFTKFITSIVENLKQFNGT